MALPRELTPDQQRETVRGFVDAAFVERGMVADVALHEGHHPAEPNPHAHILLTTRTLTPDGFGPKNRDWNAKELLGAWRTQWEIECNQALEEAGKAARVDARSLADQGIDRLPTVHEGVAVRQMERRGIATERGDGNRAVAAQQQVGIALARVRAEKTAAQLAAVGRLEEELGRLLDAAYLRQQRDAMAQKQHAARSRLTVIAEAGKRLTTAAAALTRQDQARTEETRWETWDGRFRRIFSKASRNAYERAREARRRAEETLRSIAPDLATWSAVEAERARQLEREREIPALRETVRRQEWASHPTWAQVLAGFEAAEHRAAASARVVDETREQAPYRHLDPSGIEIVYLGGTVAKPSTPAKPAAARTRDDERDRGYSR